MNELCQFVFKRKSYIAALAILVSLIISLGGYLYSQNEKANMRILTGKELEAIAEFKSRQITDWYQDELADASTISKNRVLIQMAKQFTNTRSEHDKINLKSYLKQIKEEHDLHDVILTNPDGTLLASASEGIKSVDKVLESAVAKAFSEKSVTATDIFICDIYSSLQIDFVSPLYETGKNPFAAAVFQINPEDVLSPILKQWPAHYNTAETMMARREKDSAVVLSRVKHFSGVENDEKSFLRHRKSVVANAAVGKHGLLDVNNYRGEDVLAYAAPVKGTSWFVISRIDKKEILKDLSSKVFFTMLVVILLIAVVVLGLLFIYKKWSEQELLETAMFYKNLFEKHGAVKLMLDPQNGNIIDANDAAVRFYGWTKEELKSMNVTDINTFPEDEVRHQMDKVVKQQQMHFNFKHKRADNSVRDVEVFSSLIVSKGKNVLQSIIHDVTERKEAEEKLTQSEAKFRKLSNEFQGLLNSIPDRILLINKEFKVLWSNKAAAETADNYGQNIVGEYCYGIWRKLDAPCDNCPVIKSFSSAKKSEITNTDNQGRTWRIVAAPLFDEDGSVTSVIEVARDITDSLRIEEQLRQAQKLEGLGQLAGGIAHDFNNLLNAVIGYASLLQLHMPESDSKRHYVDQIIAAAMRGAALTRQILALSRKQLLEIKPVDVNEVVKGLEHMLRRLVREDITIKYNLHHTAIVVMADAGQIGQVLINLATNAVDAMPNGGRLLISTEPFYMDERYVEMHGCEKTGKYALITVSDTGSGINEQIRTKIFDPFFTTKDVGKGTGLGLAVVHGIVKQHNGYVNVYSEEGKGATFRIYLPISEAETEKKLPEPQLKVAGGTETILIAEDDETLRTLTATILCQYGYKVIEAVDGADAVEKFAQKIDDIDLVIFDGIMPKKSGRQAFEEVRKMRSDIKAIFISGYSEDIFANDWIAGDSVLFVSKPVKPDDLLRHVRVILDGTSCS
ncbi:MAG: PAS domain S-box protein [Nitrospirae bacterium]|nr:PAS domain S-box protein [Nitrospirota bacterium]